MNNTVQYNLGKVLVLIKEKISAESFQIWFKDAIFYFDDKESQIVCIVSNCFSRDWLNSYFKRIIDEILFEIMEDEITVKFVSNKTFDEDTLFFN